MNASNKAVLRAAIINGLLWSSILTILAYTIKGVFNYSYIFLWFLFFAGTGAARKYYMLTRSDKTNK
ncbi:MAG: hypothetical protein AAF901_10910 [Bacteroidota bacterium]